MVDGAAGRVRLCRVCAPARAAGLGLSDGRRGRDAAGQNAQTSGRGPALLLTVLNAPPAVKVRLQNEDDDTLLKAGRRKASRDERERGEKKNKQKNRPGQQSHPISSGSFVLNSWMDT
jgi:hypothetical protein